MPRRQLLVVATAALITISGVAGCGSTAAPTAGPSSVVVTTGGAASSPSAGTTSAAVLTPSAGRTPSVTASPSSTATRPATPTLPGCPAPRRAPITQAPGVGKTVALTFDDGASPFTPQILAVLRRYRVHATFFDTGLADSRYPAYARAEASAGNVVGNHTYDHPMNWGYRSYFSYSAQRREVTRATTVLTGLLGHAPCVMRPPGGAYDAASLALVRSLGMSLVMWSASGNDWTQPPFLSSAAQKRIVSLAEAGARQPHPIILLHAGKASHEPGCLRTGCRPGQVSSYRGNTVAVLPAIIDFYRARGYRFVVL